MNKLEILSDLTIDSNGLYCSSFDNKKQAIEIELRESVNEEILMIT